MILRRPPRPPEFPPAFLAAYCSLPDPSALPQVVCRLPHNPLPYLQGLYRLLPAEQVQLLLQQTGRAGQRQRRLPPASILWLVIGMGLFAAPNIPKIWRAFHPHSPRREPTDSAFSQARRRLGVPPLRQAFAYLAQPMATPRTRGAFYGRWRLMAWDGTVVDVPDTPANARVFGRPGHAQGQGAFPQVRLLALCELGTHAVCAVQIKPIRCQEITMARTLVRHLHADMLVLWDRAYLDCALVRAVRARGAHVLARVKVDQLKRRGQELPDGSYLCELRRGHGRGRAEGVLVRVIEYTHNDPQRPGCGELHRLMTTILDEKELSAAQAPLVYHERWEEELVFDEWKTHLNGRALLLRSKSPAGVVQELYGQLLGHYVIRAVMHEAALAEDVDPDRLSFTNVVWTVRHSWHEVVTKGVVKWYEDLLGEVGQQELRPRRERWYPRVLKKTQADYPKKRPHHHHPPQPTKPFSEAVVVLMPVGVSGDVEDASG
jgi:Transposase DDE domain/Insertion element 4 transposase N-terminal